MKKKKSKKFIVGIVLLVIGVIGIIGLFSDTDDKISLAAGSIILIAVGVLLVYLDKKVKPVQAPAPVQTPGPVQTSEPVQTPAPIQNPSPVQTSDSELVSISYKLKVQTPVPVQSSAQAAPSVNVNQTARSEYICRRKAEFKATLDSIPRVDIAYSKDKINRRLTSDMPEIKFTNITRATKIEGLFPLAVVDVETTGIQVRGNDIIEVSAIRYDVGFKPVSCFTTLVKPRGPIPPEIAEINNITDEMVKGCKPFSAVAPAFSEYISGCNIVGHNLSFDLKFLFVCGAKLPENVKYYDTLVLAKRTLKAEGDREYDHHSGTYHDVEDYDVDDYKLKTLCDYYNIYRDDAHRSLSDCQATAMLLECLIEDKTE